VVVSRAAQGDAAPPVPRNPTFDSGYRPHNINVYPQRPDRAYLGYIDGGVIILDISDKSHPREITRYNYSPPYNGFTHTAMPLFSRNLLIVTDECTNDNGKDWPKLAWCSTRATRRTWCRFQRCRCRRWKFSASAAAFRRA